MIMLKRFNEFINEEVYGIFTRPEDVQNVLLKYDELTNESASKFIELYPYYINWDDVIMKMIWNDIPELEEEEYMSTNDVMEYWDIKMDIEALEMANIDWNDMSAHWEDFYKEIYETSWKSTDKYNWALKKY